MKVEIVSDPEVCDLSRPPEVVAQPLPPTRAERAERCKRLHLAGVYVGLGVLSAARAFYMMDMTEMAWLLGAFALTLWGYLTWRVG